MEGTAYQLTFYPCDTCPPDYKGYYICLCRDGALGLYYWEKLYSTWYYIEHGHVFEVEEQDHIVMWSDAYVTSDLTYD